METDRQAGSEDPGEEVKERHCACKASAIGALNTNLNKKGLNIKTFYVQPFLLMKK